MMNPSLSGRKALVLGATGGIGHAIAAALAARGMAIHALARNPTAARETLAKGGRPQLAITWHQGDALDAAAVRRAAEGASLIVHAVNPPAYKRWREDGVPMLAHSLAAAEAVGARLVFTGNVYVYSPESGALVDEMTPHRPRTTKGEIRRDMEAMIAEAGTRGVRSLVVRAGDYFGPGIVNSWFGQMLVKKGDQPGAIRDLTPKAGHSWAYVPDLAETFARIAEREADLPVQAVYHFKGHWLEGGEMPRAVARAFDGVPLKIEPYPWWTMYLIAPVVPFVRRALAMRWLWQHPLELDNSRLVALLGVEPHTPLDEAVRATLGRPDPAQAAVVAQALNALAQRQAA